MGQSKEFMQAIINKRWAGHTKKTPEENKARAREYLRTYHPRWRAYKWLIKHFPLAEDQLNKYWKQIANLVYFTQDLKALKRKNKRKPPLGSLKIATKGESLQLSYIPPLTGH